MLQAKGFQILLPGTQCLCRYISEGVKDDQNGLKLFNGTSLFKRYFVQQAEEIKLLK